MSEFTKAEREYLDAAFSPGWRARPDEILEAARAVRAERREAEQAKANHIVVTDALDELEGMARDAAERGDERARSEATIGLTVTDWREQERLLLARIADLEAALAEERAKPKKGAANYYTSKSLDGTTCFVHERVLAWTYIGTPSSFTGPDAERLAYAHAARLQAYHDAKGVG